MKCCMHYHSMGIIKIYFGKSQENLKKPPSRASKLQQEGLPPTDIFLRISQVRFNCQRSNPSCISFQPIQHHTNCRAKNCRKTFSLN